MASSTKMDCVAVALELESIQQEMPLIDHATEVAEKKVILALLGAIASQPPTPATLDLLAKCFDSSARLNPTIDVVPIFPYLVSSLAERINELGAPENVLASPNNETQATELVSLLNAVRTGSSPPLKLSLPALPPSPPPLPSAQAPHSLLASTQARIIGNWDGPLVFKTVAVGGTFDRLHAGHRLLLSATALVATERIFVGVTSDKLLASKKNKELLEPYEYRAAAAVDYMKSINANIVVAAGPLTDPKIPPIAATQAGFEAIVVSEETIHGAEEINHVRKSLGYEPLVIVVVGLIAGATAGGGKLSSTDLRSNAAAKGGNLRK